MPKKLTAVIAATSSGGSFAIAFPTSTATAIFAMKASAIPNMIGRRAIARRQHARRVQQLVADDFGDEDGTVCCKENWQHGIRQPRSCGW